MFKLVPTTGVSEKCAKNSTLHKEPLNNCHTVSMYGLFGKTQIHLPNVCVVIVIVFP